jgi:hypothetical protein
MEERQAIEGKGAHPIGGAGQAPLGAGCPAPGRGIGEREGRRRGSDFSGTGACVRGSATFPPSLTLILITLLAFLQSSPLSGQVNGDSWITDFSKLTVPLEEIVSGGPGKDGIPALDRPSFETVREAGKWLANEDPVAVVRIGLSPANTGTQKKRVSIVACAVARPSSTRGRSSSRVAAGPASRLPWI